MGTYLHSSYEYIVVSISSHSRAGIVLINCRCWLAVSPPLVNAGLLCCILPVFALSPALLKDERRYTQVGRLPRGLHQMWSATPALLPLIFGSSRAYFLIFSVPSLPCSYGMCLLICRCTHPRTTLPAVLYHRNLSLASQWQISNGAMSCVIFCRSNARVVSPRIR